MTFFRLKLCILYWITLQTPFNWTTKLLQMAMLYQYVILTILVVLKSSIVEPYSSGAPDDVCKSMVPGHGQIIQTTDPPYTISTNASETFGLGRIIVKIEAKPDAFKGFMIQARNSDGDPMGKFYTGVHKTLCEAETSNTVTHTSPEDKSIVTLEWEAPANFEGDVKFIATIVQTFRTYWTNVMSDNVKVEKRSVNPSSSGTPKAPNTKTDVKNSGASGYGSRLTDLYQGCGSTKSCYGPTEKCIKKKDCKFLVTYTDAGSGNYEFELVGKRNSARKYIAVGLSFDPSMGSDGVIVCGNENGVIDVYNSWNSGKDNINVIKPKEGITVLEVAEIDGSTYCRFYKDAKFKNQFMSFDLENEKYHIMVAEGTIDSNGKIQYHSENKVVSASPVALGVTSNLQTRDTRLMRVIHGSLMIGAWICAASCGILFARYYKKTWLRFKCCSMDQWFHAHRFFMVTTWSLTIAAFVVIVYELKEFRPTTHAIIGVISVGLCFIQPFMAALRPAPNGKNRSLFNWAHWLVGNAAQILGIAAIFFGFEIFMNEENNWVKEFAWYVVIAFIAFHCFIHIILSISQCIGDRKPKEVGDVFPLKEFAGSRTPLQPEDKISDAPHAGFRKFILTIYLILNWCATALLILIVVVKREDIEAQWEAWNLPAFWEHK